MQAFLVFSVDTNKIKMTIQFFMIALLLVSSSFASNDDDIDNDVEKSSLDSNEALRQSSAEFTKSASSLMEVLQTVKIAEDGVGIGGRGSKLMRMAIPLIIGFKIASLIVASIGVLKAFVVKTVLISGLSLIVSLALAAKFILDKLGRSARHSETPLVYYTHPYSSPSEPIPTWEHSAGAYENPSTAQSEIVQGKWSQSQDAANSLNSVPSSVATAQRKTILKPNAYKISMYKTTVKEVSNRK